MTSVRLSDVTSGRDNNFNLIRVVAALAVLITHSYALATGNVDAEPLRATLGKTVGAIAVDAFFITSGFLVTASLLARQSTIEFVLARALRIFPALLVMLLLTILVLGPWFTALPFGAYFASNGLYIYLAKCSTLILGVAYNLPGVFADNPYPDAVNGSLWTMPYELRMYALLAAIWAALRLSVNRPQVLRIFVVVSTVSAGLYTLIAHYTYGTVSQFAHLYFMFFSGATFFILKQRIILHPPLFWTLLCGVALATPYREVFFAAYTISVAYILFYIAYVPAGVIRKYNRLGDYSYGIYIYAFPIQQSVAALVPGVSVFEMNVLSIAATIPLAVASWHLLERRALELKGPLAGQMRRRLASFASS